jgi:hypothetical protein
MKKTVNIFALFVVLALSLMPACAIFAPYAESTVVADPAVCVALPADAKTSCRLAADVLNKSYVSLAAVNATIKDNVLAGAFTPAYAQSLLDKSIDTRKKLDKAYTAFQAGSYADALSQANIVNTLLTALTAELVKREGSK